MVVIQIFLKCGLLQNRTAVHSILLKITATENKEVHFSDTKEPQVRMVETRYDMI